MTDFVMSNHVSVGLHGRADEVIFEATVRNSSSPLYNSRVVLRELTSVQAQRRGRRALEVLKKLARRQLMYHSYAMQVHGYVSSSSSSKPGSFILVHGYHGSYSLRHWLQLSDWLPTLEATLALDDEWARRVGDDTIGGPAVTRQLRLTRILMRDLLIGVNYLHSHGLAHTELRLENLHISPVDKHVKVGILGNAVDLYDKSSHDSLADGNTVRKTLMIGFDMRCVGFIMAKMILRELMEPSTFTKFKSFLTKGNDPSCLREFLLPILSRDSPSGNDGLQMLDRNWGAGWNLLSLLLATKPSDRISCLDALRHPFLCGPKWRVEPSMDIIRWGLGSTTVRMAEDYIYVRHQRSRIAHFIELMELLNPHPRRKNWLKFLPGRWRLLYCTGRHIGLTLRQPSLRVLINNAYLTFTPSSDPKTPTFSLSSDVSFTVMPSSNWPHNKSGTLGYLHTTSSLGVAPGRRLYLREDNNESSPFSTQKSNVWKVSSRKLKELGAKEPPFGLPTAKLVAGEIDVEMRLEPMPLNAEEAGDVLREARTQIPPEMFDVSKFVCGTYVDSRLLVLRGVNGSALLFTRSCSLS
ncbi:probable plastid-lipid-associated protein 14, chloroplastic isoform X2 [Asparagus officinalis]|uniref:probable plastid-lipid-associated protein 14, chloroplastic isoform X2 n=1 Tax=Asparagus officinalis TaxID=4686 RepID=UPI00098DE5BD|nr:probable plastid-lipid-associated protein 14, chloroplastic isoform X2 [Asparagus officinalis]